MLHCSLPIAENAAHATPVDMSVRAQVEWHSLLEAPHQGCLSMETSLKIPWPVVRPFFDI